MKKFIRIKSTFLSKEPRGRLVSILKDKNGSGSSGSNLRSSRANYDTTNFTLISTATLSFSLHKR